MGGVDDRTQPLTGIGSEPGSYVSLREGEQRDDNSRL